MKSISAVLIALLATSVSAGPIIPTVTIALANDQTGAQGSAAVPADGSVQSISALYGNTGVGSGGVVKASSAQLTNFQANTNCVITNYGSVLATLNSRNTYVDLDGNPSAAQPVDLSAATVKCTV
ncbi:hypothetical protein AtubIFM57258_004130 [Aspergillus tubingensis]|uniref:Uncharacterized protein n=1 Tax=Aspergillus tubingensis (strain CBS 134.48) TaxID=767770 RepID=A0A1L9NJZ9_ASPTC|nr:hypothetical protein ASPTUDRAFT_49301 [Aspergillus tubingensis CBS 134.48]GLB08242.1 hypothetical protein AtubIFM57258_004130 [Aspergillus tubingensis]